MQNTQFVGVNTALQFFKTHPQNVSVQGFYHGTLVAELKLASNHVTLNSGGRRTVTTKRRLNQFSNQFCMGAFCVYEKKGEWFIHFDKQRFAIIFRDRITINYLTGEMV